MGKAKGWLVVVALAVVGVVVSGPSQAADEKLVEPGKKAVEHLGDETIALLKTATKVECFRIQPQKSPDDKVKRIGGYTIIETGKEQGKDFAVRLDNVLFTEATYEGRSAKCFEPGVAFRIWTDKKEWVDVVICYHCMNFDLTAYDGNGKALKQKGFGAFGGTPSWPALVKLAKEAFPDDKEIQALKEDAK